MLGLGNDILTDDAVGLRVADALARRFSGEENIVVTQTTEMGLALLDLITGFDALVIVDAVQTGRETPGFVHEFHGDDLKALPVVSPHFLGVGEMLALGRKLGLPVPSLVTIFAVEVRDPFTVGTSLTPEIEAALPGIVERVAAAARTQKTERLASSTLSRA